MSSPTVEPIIRIRQRLRERKELLDRIDQLDRELSKVSLEHLGWRKGDTIQVYVGGEWRLLVVDWIQVVRVLKDSRLHAIVHGRLRRPSGRPGRRKASVTLDETAQVVKRKGQSSDA